MERRGDFRVVIAGGGITGLSLASMLQLHDIDYVLLELNPDTAPQLDANISLLPHGNRILDQLGLYHQLLALGTSVDLLHFRGEAGEMIREVRGLKRSMQERHGYPIISLSLQKLLQVLYNNIHDKEKILTKKEVRKVELNQDGVVVRTSDGSSYEGDILVGADGYHSTVRENMWHIADQTSPGWIPPDEQDCPTSDYACITGRSGPFQDLTPESRTSVLRKHQSYFINSGPDGRIYWSYFFELAQRTYGLDRPKFTKQDEQMILDARKHDDITQTLKFQQVLDKRISGTILMPLEEYIFRQWYFQRIITIGDAAHISLPITGHSENACLESAAALLNTLRTALARSCNTKPTLEQIECAFATTQSTRQARLTIVKNLTHAQQRRECLDTPFHRIGSLYLLPRADADVITETLSSSISLAERLNGLMPGAKPLLIPYKDALLKAPEDSGVVKWYFVASYLLIAGLCYYGMWVQPGYYGLWDHLNTVLTTGEFPYDSGFPLKRTYIGNKFIDTIFVYLSAVFMSGLKDWDPSFRFMNIYFLGVLVQPIAVWTVEAYRRRNRLTPLSLVTIWYTLFQFTGVGIFMPVYYAVYSLVSESSSYWWPLNRGIPVHHAESMIWAVMIGYALPTAVLFVPYKDPFILQNVESFWQISPMLVPLLCTFFAQVHRSRRVEDVQKPQQVNDPPPDLKPLKQLYIITGTLGLLFHVYCVLKVIRDTGMTISSVFWPDFVTQKKTLAEGVKFMFLIDLWALEVATYIWLCQAVWDLKRVGRTNANVAKAAGLIAVGTVFLGSGATICGVWYWREIKLAQRSFATAMT